MAFRSSAKASASSGSITATPVGVTAGDVLVALFNEDSGSATTPTGWSLSGSSAPYGPDGQSAYLYTKGTATGSDSFLFAGTSVFGMAVVAGAWSGRDNATPFAVSPVGTTNSSSNSSPVSVSLSGLTAAASDDLAVLIATDQTDQTARWSFSAVSGFTSREDGVSQDYCSGITLQSKDAASAGATGSLASTITRTGGADGTGWQGWIVSIKAAAGGGGGSPVTGKGRYFHSWVAGR